MTFVLYQTLWVKYRLVAKTIFMFFSFDRVSEDFEEV
jgi:hypothetical protein